MVNSPRLVVVDNEEDARREALRVGADPAGVERMADKMVCRVVKVPGVPCKAANILKQEMLSLGGDAAVARGTVSCSLPETDVLLIGSLKVLRLLCERLGVQPFGLAQLGRDLKILIETSEAAPSTFSGRSVTLRLDRPLIMGILNVTPDSFSDGGAFDSVAKALEHGRRMESEGADLIDVGGESTRPGSDPVPLQEELDRVIPVIEVLRRETALPISIDTTKSVVAREAVAAGAEFVNDISGLTYDEEMSAVCAQSGAGLILMHTRGIPRDMQADTFYEDLMGEIIESLEASVMRAASAGIPRGKLVVDPGVGFAKSVEGNLEIIKRLSELKTLGLPILLGTSRKSFIGKILQQPVATDRLMGTMATVALGVERGAHIFRVHDVAAARQTALMSWAVCRGVATLPV